MNDQRAITAQPHVTDADPVPPHRALLGDSAPPSTPGGECVLIVAEGDVNVRLLETMLAMAGAAGVHTLSDARTVLDRCLEIGPDLVMVDLDMAHLDALAVVRSLRLIRPEEGFLPVIALSRDSTTPSRARALDAGVHDYVTKPLDQVQFVGRATNLLKMRALYQEVLRNNRKLRAQHDHPANRAATQP